MVDQRCIAFPDPDRPPFARGPGESISSNILLTGAANPGSSHTTAIEKILNVTSASVLDGVRDDLSEAKR